MPTQVLGPFELLEQLGAGGMGVVYRARYTKTGQIVAVKLITPFLSNDQKLVARFERELEVLKKMKHPHIVQCFGGGRQGQQRFYAMELIEGGSLADLLEKKKRISWEETIQYGLEISSALEHAHEHGIVHRDLKPANLMLDKAGRIKLADFGLARVADATAITAAGKTLGTMAYMAPEQITGNSPITHKTDLYALGCVFYELLTGSPPFQAESVSELFYQHLKKKPPKVRAEVMDCPIWLENLILQLLEKDPDKRPRDSMAVSQALREINEKVAGHVGMVQHSMKGEPSALSVEADRDEISKLLKKKKKKRRGPDGPIYERTWFLAACLLLIIAGITWSVWPLNESQLFAKAAPLMAGDDVAKWQEARDKYLIPLQTRFPKGRYATDVQDFLDKIEMHRAEQRIKTRIRLGTDLESEAERLFAEAWRYEQFGDRVTALDKYSGMIQVLKDRKDDRPFVNLARRQIARLEEAGTNKDDRLKLVDESLARAEQLYKDGNPREARKTWESIVDLYNQNRELLPQVKQARARLSGEKPAPLSQSGAKEAPAVEAEPDPADTSEDVDAESDESRE